MGSRPLIWGALLVVACSSTAYQAPPPHPPGPVPPPIVTEPTVAELPAHHFFAREHTPRSFPTPTAVSFTALPAMVRSRKCIDAGSVPEGRPSVATTTGRRSSKPKGKTAPGFVPYAGAGDGKAKEAKNAAPTEAARANKDARADNRKAPPTATPSAPDAVASAPRREPAGAGAAESEEAAEMAPADDMGGADFASAVDVDDTAFNRSDRDEAQVAKPSRGDKRRVKRSRRKAKRAHDKALAAQSPGMAETSPEPPPVSPGADEDPIGGEALQPVQLEPQWPPPEEGWGAATFLSNDDTMSLSSAQRVLFAIDEHLPLPPQHVRPHELLNYFSFDTKAVAEGYDFSVQAQIAPSRREPDLYAMGLAIASRPMGREGRRNAALTVVIDRSGSMKAEGRMDYVKRGLLRMVRELKTGDVLHVVTFDHRVCVPLRNFVVGRDDVSALTDTIHGIRPSGRTNLHAGLDQAYQLADASYQPKYTNRVLVITDALANAGDTSPRTMSMISDWYDARRIRLSGIGVGREFNDALLDGLTEKGRGAYVFLGSEAEVDAVFGPRFVSLVETVANDVHFRLHLPPSLRMQAFHGEESSTVKREVQAVHFFADTSQLMLADVEAWQGELRPQDDVMLEIEYQDPETGETLVEDHVVGLGQMLEQDDNVRKAEVITTFIEAIERQAWRGAPQDWSPRPGTWRDAAALEDCQATRGELRELAAGSRDPEVARVLSLWDGYCERFEGAGPPRPGRKDTGAWPGAQRRPASRPNTG